jgi:hypothetical protein
MAQPRRPIAAPRTTLPPAAACSLKCVTAAPRSALGTPQYVLVPIGTRQHASVCARARECGTASRATVQARCLTAAAAGGNSSGAQTCTEPIPGSPLNHSAHSQHCGQRDMSPEGMAHCLSVCLAQLVLIAARRSLTGQTGGAVTWLRVACCMLHVACCVLRAACCTLHVACCVLHVACCVLHVACCVLRVACCVLRAACCVLRAACCVLRAACCVLRVACCVLHAAC